MLVHRRALSRATRPALRRSLLQLCRQQSTKQSKPVQVHNETDDPPSVLVEENASRNTLFTLDFFRRFIKFSAIGVLTVGVTTGTALWGAHMWVESAELASERDEEVRKWEWDLEAERWSGGPTGGTDPGLGFTGRFAVRSAWMSQHWGTGSGVNVIDTRTYGGRAPSTGSSLNAVETRLAFAHDFLNIAINTALKDSIPGKLRPETLTELIARHAGVLERIGTKDALFEARAEFERVWAGLPGKGLDAARIALKLGDLNKRLGDPEDALAWWARAIQLTRDTGRSNVSDLLPVVPESVPSSPLAQRTLISTLISLSAHYASSGQLPQARALEETSLDLLRSIKQPDSFESATPPQALHALYILHRSSLLSIHLAEVMYAQKEKPATSMQWLSRAAESSERVVLALTGLPAIHPDAPESQIPHPPSSETSLIAVYTKSRTMIQPAKSLLRDSRRAAAEAWSLMGILAESSGGRGSVEKAFECYERALGWAGVASDMAGGIGKPGEGTLEGEWQALWSNYVRVRDITRKQQESKT